MMTTKVLVEVDDDVDDDADGDDDVDVDDDDMMIFKIKKCEPQAITGHCNAIFIRSSILTFSFAFFIPRM